MNHEKFINKLTGEEISLAVDHLVDILFCRIIATLFEDWDFEGPVDFEKRYDIEKIDYYAIQKSCGMESFLKRLEDHMRAVVQNLRIFNDRPTDEKTTLRIKTNWELSENDKEFPFRIYLGVDEIEVLP